MTALVVIGIILMALFGAPLFSIFGAASLFGFHSVDINTSAVIIQMTQLVSAPAMVAIPLFTFAGYMMAESKTPERLVAVSQALFGWMPGGLAIVTLFACSFFTAFTGASGVTIIALGGLLYPILKKRGFKEGFSLGLVTCSGSLGLLFPPSLPIILYGVIGQVDVDKLFVAGILPGVLLLLLLGTYSVICGAKSTTRVKFKVKDALKAIQAAAWELPLPLIVLVGIYGGFTTASEAAAVCAFYVFIVEVFIYRDLKIFTDIPRVMKDSMVLVGGILIIVAVALGFTNFVIDQEVPMKLFELTKKYITSPAMFLVVLNVFLLIVGCLIDIFSAIIVVVPIIAPIARGYGIDPVHLGIIFLTNLEIGYLTPPFGLNLFLSSYRFKKPIARVFADTLPFLLILFAALLIITYVPALSLTLLAKFH
ncbi:MAG TPA: TRAP transporter large permease [bacterium]|nr:TRAP transporter large permease [bacterium]